MSGLYYADFISFTALLNCAEVGRRNRILTNYRFLSPPLLSHGGGKSQIFLSKIEFSLQLWYHSVLQRVKNNVSKITKMRLGQSSLSIFGFSSKTQWVEWALLRWFHQLYRPTQLCGGGTTNRILTNYRFLSHSHSFCFILLVLIARQSDKLGRLGRAP